MQSAALFATILTAALFLAFNFLRLRVQTQTRQQLAFSGAIGRERSRWTGRRRGSVRPPIATRLASSPAMSAPAPASLGMCLDCGAPRAGKFCGECGQKDEPLARGLRAIVLDAISHPLIDTKTWRSLVALLLRPGELTLEHSRGRRTRYLRPLKLYITVSVAFFSLATLLGRPPDVVRFDGPAANAASAEKSPRPHLPIRSLDGRLQKKIDLLEAPGSEGFKHSLQTKINEWLPSVVFALLPLAALLLKALWWRRLYVEHLVFMLHLHAYAFAAAIVLLVRWSPLSTAVGLASVVYAVVAFKRVYGNGWAATVAKVFALGILYTVLVFLALFTAAFSALMVT